MLDYLDLVCIAIGLALLVAGGEALVRGSVTTAERLGVSPLIIGVTLVAFGTSAPELVTSIHASLSGAPGIAIGNIVGSNIANLLLILGIAALVAPIALSRQVAMNDGSIMLAATLAFCAVGYVFSLERFVGIAFMLALVAYLYTAYRRDAADMTAAVAGADVTSPVNRDHAETGGVAFAGLDGSGTAVALSERTPALAIPLGLAALGLALLFAGASLLVDGATGLARAAGISEAVIGLSVVAIGTSLPELVASVAAALKRQTDMALGNVLGSNLYNLLGIGGMTALIAPTSVPAEIINFDNFVMLAATVAVLALAWLTPAISRPMGVAFFAAYVAYIASIWPA